jgi:hypothetical protein
MNHALVVAKAFEAELEIGHGRGGGEGQEEREGSKQAIHGASAYNDRPASSSWTLDGSAG